MNMYKIHINNRNYTSWTCYEVLGFKPIEIENLTPVENKMFSNDSFTLSDNVIKIEHSPLRISSSIPGVLVLKSSKTYGRSNGTSGRLLYKVVPDDIRIPAFLVPYEVKNMGFSKVFVNLYVTFTYSSWDGKHPIGCLTNVIGPVDILDNFYEYQLYCKSLHSSIQKFTKDTSKSIKIQTEHITMENIKKKYNTIEDRTEKIWRIFTIDPVNTTDFDDAFSISDTNCNKDIECVLSIYISNVTIWLDVLDLWKSFSRRVATIYLPDRKKPMLPTILSDNLCSLQEKVSRIAFYMDITLNKETGEIKNINYGNCIIRVFKNYRYEEASLLKDIEYKRVFELTKLLSKIYRYLPIIRNSHDVVSYLMTLMNYYAAKDLWGYKNGLFRYSIIKNYNVSSIPNDIPEEVSKFIQIWNSSGGQYIDASSLNDDEEMVRHELINMDAYVHITSPIRRLVDLLNIIKFQQNHNMVVLSDNATKFYTDWTSPSELEYINTTMRSIRKVQNDCSMLELYTNNPEKMEQLYDGYIFDKIERTDGTFQYMAYLPELKFNAKIVIHDNLNNHEKYRFKIYLFHDEENLKKKIRLQIVYDNISVFTGDDSTKV